VGAQEEVGDAEQAAVAAVFPGVAVVEFGGVVRRDAVVRDFGYAVGVQYRVLTGEHEAYGPVEQLSFRF
jgi:hypothetical protein